MKTLRNSFTYMFDPLIQPKVVKFAIWNPEGFLERTIKRHERLPSSLVESDNVVCCSAASLASLFPQETKLIVPMPPPWMSPSASTCELRSGLLTCFTGAIFSSFWRESLSSTISLLSSSSTLNVYNNISLDCFIAK